MQDVSKILSLLLLLIALAPQHPAKEFIKQKEETVGRNLVQQSRPRSPQECHAPTLVPGFGKALANAALVHFERRGLEPGLDDIQWIGDPGSHAAGNGPQEHVAAGLLEFCFIIIGELLSARAPGLQVLV